MKELLVVLLLSGCATAEFTPTTKEGAACKMDCAQSPQTCRSSSTCGRSYIRCIEACREINQ
jgi:hypothetical protein